jgi:hypothetical protein
VLQHTFSLSAESVAWSDLAIWRSANCGNWRRKARRGFSASVQRGTVVRCMFWGWIDWCLTCLARSPRCYTYWTSWIILGQPCFWASSGVPLQNLGVSRSILPYTYKVRWKFTRCPVLPDEPTWIRPCLCIHAPWPTPLNPIRSGCGLDEWASKPADVRTYSVLCTVYCGMQTSLLPAYGYS